MPHHVYRLASAFEWVFGFSFVFAGLVGGPAAALAQAAPSSGVIDLSNGNTQVILIGLGCVAVFAKFLDTAISGYKQYITARGESALGRLASCESDREVDRKSAAENLLAARSAHASDIDRWKAQYGAMVKDYEDRLESKRAEAEYLRQMIDAAHAVEQQLRQANEALTATLVHQNQAFIGQNQQIAKIADRSVENTNAAIRKIPKTASVPGDSDIDIQSMTVTSEKTNIIVTPDPDGTRHA